MSLIEDAKAEKKAGLSGKRCLNCGCQLSGAKLKYCSKECREDMRWKISNGGKFV